MAEKGAAATTREFFDPKKIYDASEQEMRAIQERAQMRTALKEEFRRKVTNPYKPAGGYIHDPVMQRFFAMRVTHWENFKPMPSNFLFFICTTVVPIGLLTWYLETSRAKREKKYRSGVVSYADRSYKFAS